MSDPLVHAMVGDWIGETLAKLPDKRLNNGFLAAVLAFGSHAWLDMVDQDYTPNWVAWRKDAARLRKDLPYIALQIMGLAATLVSICREKDKQVIQTRLAGVLGALAPDIIDGVYAYLNPQAWQKGELILPWHRAAANGKQVLTREQAICRTAYLTLLQLRF
ncbi:MAG TPA: hypothetical protein GXZ82_08275 [Firmicutes bacterium]|nr:hypothetical protein [Bacillota bacterium]